ncbi:LLM class flavin-dependent oxidoreductase [Herbiconiux sp. 11R-BC]|uniref:LLM class flavin-dependent oxidoreductase n=1 Tax=Herbiconiux sp. 11R-BC TaxID=3111637 RepID=UPI003C063CEA
MSAASARRVEIGIGLQSDKEPGRYAQIASRAEALGIDVVTVFSDLLYQPPVAPLLEVAKATERVRLGVACWNPYTLHPYEIAGQLAALDRASGGRAYLGLAKGTWLDAIGLGQPTPLRALEDAAGFIRALLSGDGEGYEGRMFRLEPGVRLRYTLERADPPLLIGSWGPRGAELAGRIADEIKIGGSANPAMVGVTRERLAVGEAAAGRPLGSVGVVLGAVTVVSLDRTAARTHARRQVAMYLDAIAALDPTVTLPEDLLPRIRELLRDGDEEAAGRLVPSDVLDLFAFSGTPDDVAAQAQSLIDAGVARVEFGTPLGIDELEGLELLGTRVLPQLER